MNGFYLVIGSFFVGMLIISLLGQFGYDRLREKTIFKLSLIVVLLMVAGMIYGYHAAGVW